MTAFAIASESVFQDRRLSGADLRLLLALLSHTRPGKSHCWPSRARLAQLIGIKSHSRVSEILGRLVALGWISVKRTGRSSLYFVHAPGTTSDVHPVVEKEKTSEYLEEKTPIPPRPDANLTQVIGAIPETDEQPAMPIALQGEQPGRDGAHPETAAPTAMAHEDVHQVAGSAKPAPSKPTAELPETTQDRAALRLERVQAAMRVVAHLNRITGSAFPTNDPSSIAVRRASRALARFAEPEIEQIISSHAPAFRSPASILKRSVLEPLVSELRAQQQRRQRALEADQKRLDELRKGAGTRTREGAQAGIRALRSALGRGSRSPDPETLEA